MFKVRVSTSDFTDSVKEYQKLTGKAMAEVVTEQSRLLAVRLTQLTYPKTAGIGKKRVAIDIGRVYMSNSWFETSFQFNNQKYGDRVQQAVRSKNQEDIRAMFQNSQKLRLIRVEPFDPATHAKLRRDGRIKIPNPNTFPVSTQSQVKAYTRQKQRNVGLAKSGWATCASDLGKSQPNWLNKSGAGKVERHLNGARPSITMTNLVSFFSDLDARANIVSRALDGRARDMIKSAESQLRRAAKDARLAA